MKRLSWITAILFCAALLGFCIWFWALPDRELSYEENRPLQTFPEFSFSDLVSGAYSKELSSYFADQFPLRDAFVGMKALLELSFGKGENDGILLGAGGQLARRLFRLSRFPVATDVYDRAALSKKTKAIADLSECLKVPMTVLIPARAIDVAASAFSYPEEGSREVLEQLKEELSGCVFSDPNAALREAYDRGESVWYKTDHHWTSLGAYYAYLEVMRSFGMEKETLPLDSFERKLVSTSFFGTLASASGMNFAGPDEVELFLSGREEDYEVIADGKKLPGLYATEALSGKDHYSVFLDGTHDVVSIRKKNGEVRPLLLVAKDSFANSLAPFLALHFDLLLLNLSSVKQDFTDLSDAVEEYRPQRVLLVYSLENLLTSDRILTLR